MGQFNTAQFNADQGTAANGASIILLSALLRSSFRCIGQLRPGFGYSPSELIDALFILNSMLDSWGTDDLNCFCDLIQSFAMVPGIQNYTLGPGGTWNGSRPVRIDKATLVVLTNPALPLRLDVEIINVDQYQSINLQQTASPIPRKMFYNPTVTTGTVSLWTVPTTSDLIELTSTQSLAEGFTDSAQAFIAPPGYRDAVRYQLAIRLAMEWDKPLKDGVMLLATEALAKIQRLNASTPMMDVNPGVLPISGSRGNWSRLTGD